MSSDRFDDNQNLPPWLRDVPLPPRPRASEAASQNPAPPPPAADAALPDWLSDVSAAPASTPSSAASTPASSAGDLPDWLRDFSNNNPDAATQAPNGASEQTQLGQAASSAANNALPDWLQEFGDTSAPSAPAQSSDAPQRSDLPDWLREVQDAAPPAATALPSAASEPPAPSGEALPSWLADLAEPIAGSESSVTSDWAIPPEPAAQSAPANDEGMPSWLRPDAPTATPPAASSQPSWLQAEDRALQAPEPTPPASEDEETLPSWLHSAPEEIRSSGDLAPFTLDEPSDTSSQATQPRSNWLSNEIEDDAGMPSWLQPDDASAGRTAPPAEQPLQREDQFSAPEPPSGDVPDWLAGASASAPETPSGDVPSWLSDTVTSTPDTSGSGDVPDWLADASASAPETPSGDVPSWLSDTVTSTPDTSGSGDVPDWLAGASASAPETPSGDVPSWLSDTVTSTPDTSGSGDVPDWLKAPAPDQSASEQPSAGNLPDWLRDTATSEQPQPDAAPDWLGNQPDEALPTPSGDAAPPAWLASESAAPASPPTTPAENSDSLPGWLTDTAPPSGSAASPAADELPAWLRPNIAPASPPPVPPAADDLPPWLRDDAGQPLPMASPSGDSKLPTWLHGASDDVAPAAPAEETVPTSTWLNEAPAVPTAPADSLVGGVELPPWLRPPEAEPIKEEINPTDARSLDWLTRLGSQEEEEVEVAPQTSRLRPPALPQRSAAQVEAIALLEHLAAEPFPGQTTTETAETPAMWQRVGVERLLYIVLALVVILALLMPAPNFLGMNEPPSAPGAAALFTQIDTLGENDIVLVGYEWDARRSAELRPLEQAVFDHLIARHVKLVLISTDPQGSLLLYDLREKLGAAGYKPSGEDYILLGYKPGAELALRAMAQNFPATLTSDFQGNDASGSLLATTPDHQQRLKTLDDFSMVLVLSDEASDVQGWMEQVRTSAQRADGSYVPFAFVLPSETTPIVQPYLGQPNVLHLAGKQGALAYQQQRGIADAQVVAEAGQMRFSLLLYLALLIVGAVVVGIHSAATRGRNRK